MQLSRSIIGSIRQAARAAGLLAAGLLLLAGCASSGNGPATGSSSKSGGLLAMTSLKTGSFAKDGSYRLSKAERAQDCNRITGKMNVRIVELRHAGTANDTTAVARSFSNVLSSGDQGYSTAERKRRNLAILRAYNKLLKSKKCPTVDIESALAARRPAAPAKNASSRLGLQSQTR